MKSIALLISIFFFIKPVIPVLDYVVNFEYISEVLCLNKAKPEMECEGKCYLTNELGKNSQETSPLSQGKSQTYFGFQVLFYQDIPLFETTLTSLNTSQEINSNYSNLYFFEKSCSIFHPPNSAS